MSEFLLVQAAVADRKMWLAAIVLLLLLTAFISLLSHLNRMLYGSVPDAVPAGEHRGWPILILIVPAAVLVLFGVVLPTPFSKLIHQTVGNLIP